MHVKLKGINTVKVRGKDGSVKATYYYERHGGTRLDGEPGSPEFLKSYEAALAKLKRAPSDTLVSLLDRYESSPDFKSLARATRAGYRRHLRAIAIEFGDFPIEGLSERSARGDFLEWRDRLAVRSRRDADYCFAVFARALSWSVDRGYCPHNPLERPGRLYRASRRDQVWSADDEKLFLDQAPKHLRLALILALWTGQRQSDLLRLTWSAYDGESIRLKQQKTGANVRIPASAVLRSALDAQRRQMPDAVTILTTMSGKAWTSDGFRASWRKACEAVGVQGVTFHDLRGTAVTRLARAGCTVPEIATITGHSLRDVGAIIDASYLSRDFSMAQSAIQKLETGTVLQNGLQNDRAGRLMFQPTKSRKI